MKKQTEYRLFFFAEMNEKEEMFETLNDAIVWYNSEKKENENPKGSIYVGLTKHAEKQEDEWVCTNHEEVVELISLKNTLKD